MLTDDEILQIVTDTPLAVTGRATFLVLGRAIESAALAKAGVPAARVSGAYSRSECAAPGHEVISPSGASE